MNHSFDSRYHPQGFILTIVAIVIAAGFTILTVATSFRTLTQLDIGTIAASGAAAVSAVDGCVEEALLQLRRDAAYIGGSITVGDAACVIAAQGSDGTRTLTVTGTIGEASRTVTAGVTMSPFALTEWGE